MIRLVTSRFGPWRGELSTDRMITCNFLDILSIVDQLFTSQKNKRRQ